MSDLFDLVGKDGRRIDLDDHYEPDPNSRPTIVNVDKYKATVNGDKFRMKIWGDGTRAEIWLTHPQALALKRILITRTAEQWHPNTEDTA